MGYYTHFTVTCNDLEREGEVLDTIAEIAEVDVSYLDGTGDSLKWYDFHEDMLKVAARFPDVVIRVDGIGDENLDVWTRWYKGDEWRHWEIEPNIPEGFEPPGGW